MRRRNFLLGGAALGLGGLRLFALPPGWKPQKRPNIVFGVLADTHFRTDDDWRKGHKSNKYLTAALECFRDQNVDAVVHCGDMADRGLVEEMRLHADVWKKVFPENCAPDGHKVEKLFVTGNHDVDAWHKDFDFTRFVPNRAEWPKKIINVDLAGHWERIWGEKYEPIWHKSVKGYDFFGMNWIPNERGQGEAGLLRLIDEKMDASNGKPFFFISHDRTHNRFNKAIRRHPGAFGIWGHWHMSAANWRTVQMLNDATPSVQCPACPSWWRPTGKWMGGGDEGIVRAPLEEKLQGGKWRQGLIVRIYDDMLTIERREFSEGGSLGADWAMPLGKCNPHPFSRDEMRKVIGAPRFRRGAALEICDGGKAAKLRIPPADGNPDSRVYAHEVVVKAVGASSHQIMKAVYAAGCNMGIGHEQNGGITELAIPKSELPPGETLAFSVRPFTSLGTFGMPLSATFRTCETKANDLDVSRTI